MKVGVGLDATSLGDRFTILSLNIVSRQCVPVAWKIMQANVGTLGNPNGLRFCDWFDP